MRSFAVLAAVAVAGCSEYGLRSGRDRIGQTNPAVDPEPLPSSTAPPPLDTASPPAVDPPDTTIPPPECAPMTASAEEVELNLACDVPPMTGTFDPVSEWELTGYNAYGPPVAGQLSDDNGDGRIDAADTPDIVFLPNDNSGLVSVNGATGAVQWQSPWATDGVSGVAIGDVDGDGVPEIAAANGPNTLVLLDNLGNRIWTVALGNGALYDFLYPSIADMDGDGFAEIIGGRTIVDWLGNVVGVGTKGVGSVPNAGGSLFEGAVSVPVDLDGDGLLEVVVGNAAYNRDGTLKYSNELSDGCPAIADFDLDGEPEIVVASGDGVRTLETDLTPTGWVATFPATNYVGPPAVDDLDGDGIPDFVVVGANEMRAYAWGGALLWTATVQDASGAAGPILFDFELDGYPEVVYADEEWVRVFNGLDGSIKLESSDHSSYTGFETPIVADVDADGEVEIAMLHGNGTYGLTVFGDSAHSWPPGRQVWNQHAYSITNVEDDLTLPLLQPPNWLQYNNFRSGDAGLPPSSWNDALAEVVDVCTDECPDRLVLLVRVLNEGTEEIPPGLDVVVRAGEGGPIVASAEVADAIPSGWTSEGIEISVTVGDLAGAEPWVEVDKDGADAGSLGECDEDNNAAVSTESCP